jgi:hypothetical protein
MCSVCCGSPRSPKTKGLKSFKFNVKPTDLKSTLAKNAWLLAVKKLGWSVVDSAHVPDSHYYNSNEVWDDHVVLLRKGTGKSATYATMTCVRRPMQGKNVMRGEGKAVPLKAPKFKRNPKKMESDENRRNSKIPWSLTPTEAEKLAEIRKNLKGFKGTDRKTAEEMMVSIVDRWLKGSKRKVESTVKIEIWAPNKETAQKVLERKGWKVKIAK